VKDLGVGKFMEWEGVCREKKKKANARPFGVRGKGKGSMGQRYWGKKPKGRSVGGKKKKKILDEGKRTGKKRMRKKTKERPGSGTRLKT